MILFDHRCIDIEPIQTVYQGITHCMASRINFLFKTGLDSRVSEEKKLCLRLRRLFASSAGLADDLTSACLSFPGVSWSKTYNSSDRASCMQQRCADCLAAVS